MSEIEIGLTNEKLTSLEQSVNAISTVNPEILSVHLLASNGKTRQLLDTGIPEGMKLTRRGLEVRFKSILPLYAIEIDFAPSVSNTFKIEVNVGGEALEVSAIPVQGQSGKAIAKISKAVDGFRVRADGLGSLVGSATLLNIRPIILSYEAISSLMEVADEQQSIKAELLAEISEFRKMIDLKLSEVSAGQDRLKKDTEKFQADMKVQKEAHAADLAAIEKSLETINEEKDEVESEIEALTQKQTDAEALLSRTNANIVDIEAKIAAKQQILTTVEDLIQQKNREKSQATEEIKGLQNEVTDWMDKKNTFTAELEGVLGEYNSQIKIYSGFAAGLLVILVGLAIQLQIGATKFLEAITPDKTAEAIWTYAATRSPYVTVSLAIFFGLIALALKPLLLKIFEINDLKSLLQARVMLVTKLTRNISSKMELSKVEESRLLIDEKLKYIEETLADHFKSRLNAQMLGEMMKGTGNPIYNIVVGLADKLRPLPKPEPKDVTPKDE